MMIDIISTIKIEQPNESKLNQTIKLKLQFEINLFKSKIPSEAAV